MATKEQKQIRLLLKIELSSPSIETIGSNKCIVWTLADGTRHRDFGPAEEYILGEDKINFNECKRTKKFGGEVWYYHGKIHREDGPAITEGSGIECYYINGENLTLEEFEQWRIKNKKK